MSSKLRTKISTGRPSFYAREGISEVLLLSSALLKSFGFFTTRIDDGEARATWYASFRTVMNQDLQRWQARPASVGGMSRSCTRTMKREKYKVCGNSLFARQARRRQSATASPLFLSRSFFLFFSSWLFLTSASCTFNNEVSLTRQLTTSVPWKICLHPPAPALYSHMMLPLTVHHPAFSTSTRSTPPICSPYLSIASTYSHETFGKTDTQALHHFGLLHIVKATGHTRPANGIKGLQCTLSRVELGPS